MHHTKQKLVTCNLAPPYNIVLYSLPSPLLLLDLFFYDPAYLSKKVEDLSLSHHCIPFMKNDSKMEGIRFSSSKKEEDPATINAVDNHTNIVSARSSSTGQNIPALSTDQATFSSVSPRHDGDCEAGTHGVLLRKDCGRERLRKHIEEVAGRVMIPDTWGQENLLKDWIDCSTFDELLAPDGISSARESLVAERRRGSSPGLRIASGNWQEKVSYCRSPKDANS